MNWLTSRLFSCVFMLEACVSLPEKRYGEWFGESLLFQSKIIRPIIKIGSLSLIAGVFFICRFYKYKRPLNSRNWPGCCWKLGCCHAGSSPLIALVICMPVFSRYFSELCRAKTASEVLALYRPIIKIISVLFGFGLVMVYFLSNWIVQLLFSDSFKLYMGTMFLFVIGDVIRSYSTILNYINLASENYFKHFFM